MDDKQLKEIRDRAEKHDIITRSPSFVAFADSIEGASFWTIVALDIPALLDEIERLKREIKKIEEDTFYSTPIIPNKKGE